MEEVLLRRQRDLVRRARWVRGRDLFLEAVFLLTTISAALLLADRLAFEVGAARLHLARTPTILWTITLSLGGACLVGALGVLRSRLRPATVLWEADRWLKADALFLSGVELAQRPGERSEFEQRMFEEAEQVSQKIDPRAILPHRPLRYRWGVALGFAALAALAWAPPTEFHAPIADYHIEPLRGVAPLDIVATEAAVGWIDRYEWDFGDGTIVAGRRLQHRYDEPGLYSIKLVVSGAGGTSEVQRTTIEVRPKESVVADFTMSPRKGRAPLEVSFENLSSNAERYEWNFGDGGTSRATDPTHRYDKAGRHRVSLTASGGGRSDTFERNVRVIGPDEPMADFAAFPTRGEAPLVVAFESRSTGPIDSHEWLFGDPLDPEGSGENPHHVFRQPGTYTIRLKVKGPGGEDVEIKERFIHVEGGAGSAGGGGGLALLQNPASPNTEKPKPRPKVNPVPETVRAPGTGPMIEKIKNVYTDSQGGAPGGEEPYEKAFGRYRKAEEEALERESVPPAARDLIRRYFEAIRPR